ncbi:MAG: dual specificity protein phosphatase family protein [Planctomycetes bacterium]|nr:dual specificity protein phosphatase family protein [Planctomycetota bacterium]MCH9725864.1 dual specificity protein phosphatase family protein [Planctomycetota bacterium]MCH9775428.1 dual specificity protein phosphatase family protein [Planctomycetota bacterium]MCH9792738.1 dual specificity protein phosphatase family protein [Planctomycetota bacterium]
MREVIPQLLWIGNARDARDVKGVLDLGISAIIDLALEEPPISFPREIVYCRLPLIDGDENNQPVLETTIETVARFIQAEVPTLVACSAGMSRSPAIVAGALSKTKAISFREAIGQIAAIGPCDVSPGLWNQIEAWLEQK